MASEEQSKLQKLLDTFSQEPGALIYRDVDRWAALPPGPVGYVLAINSEGMPEWTDPETITFG